MRFGPSQLSYHSGRVLCLECTLSVVGSSPTWGSSFFFWKSDCLGCAVLLCLVVCLTLIDSFFLLVYTCIYMYMYMLSPSHPQLACCCVPASSPPILEPQTSGSWPSTMASPSPCAVMKPYRCTASSRSSSQTQRTRSELQYNHTCTSVLCPLVYQHGAFDFYPGQFQRFFFKHS